MKKLFCIYKKNIYKKIYLGQRRDSVEAMYIQYIDIDTHSSVNIKSSNYPITNGNIIILCQFM